MFMHFLERKKKSGEWAISRKNDKTERVRGLGRKVREEIGKRNQMTAIRLQTWVGQTSLASLQGSSKLKTVHLE